MQLIPTPEEVTELLWRTGALRRGHFLYPNGLHADRYLQVPLAMRYYQHQKTLSVALSRLVRKHPEIRAMIPELSIVTPATAGLPVAYGVCEALRARQVYWAESDEKGALRFRQFIEQVPGEKVLLVDDILRTGRRLSQLKALLEANGAEVVGLAVIVYEPYPGAATFDPLPVFYLARLEGAVFQEPATCEMCRRGEPYVEVWV